MIAAISSALDSASVPTLVLIVCIIAGLVGGSVGILLGWALRAWVIAAERAEMAAWWQRRIERNSRRIASGRVAR